METRKKIKISYTDSYIGTIKAFALLFLLLGLLVGFYVLFSADEKETVLLEVGEIVLAGIFFFLVLMGISKGLEHLLYIRKYFEAKAHDEEYEFVVENDNL